MYYTFLFGKFWAKKSYNFRPLKDMKDHRIKFPDIEEEWNPESWDYSPEFILLISSKDRTCI